MVKIDKLNKRYNDNIILKDASYLFKSNSLTCFYGESGIGKSTLFNILAGFDSDFKGNVQVDGVSLNNIEKENLAEYRSLNIGFIFQNYYLLKGYTALENVLMALYPTSDLSDAEKEAKALAVLESLNLKDEVNQKIETLSGGQKQRVSIARALVNNPSVILADEPTGALDIENSKVIMDILKDISREKTVIVITHDDEVLKYADEVITLEDKTIKQVRGYEEKEEDKSKIYNKVVSKSPKEKSSLQKRYIALLSFKNFKINKFKYILAMIMLAVSVAAFIASFSLKDISNNVMEDFKEKNSHYKTGQVDDYSNISMDKVYEKLTAMEGIEDVYFQANINDTILKQGDKEVELRFNSPSIIALENLTYGRMPNNDKDEIALSASLACMLKESIKDLVDEDLVLEYKDSLNNTKEVKLKITGITNNTSQNFILSSNIEKRIYKEKDVSKETFKSIRFEVQDFNNIPEISSTLESSGINASIRSDEIKVFKDTFSNLIKLFTILSYIIFVVGIVISCIVLYKVIDERKGEIAILGAIGYEDNNIKKIIIRESILLSIATTILALIVVLVIDRISKTYLGYGLGIDILKIILLIAPILIVDIGGTITLCKSILKRDKSKLLR